MGECTQIGPHSKYLDNDIFFSVILSLFTTAIELKSSHFEDIERGIYPFDWP